MTVLRDTVLRYYAPAVDDGEEDSTGELNVGFEERNYFRSSARSRDHEHVLLRSSKKAQQRYTRYGLYRGPRTERRQKLPHREGKMRCNKPILHM